MEMNDMILMSVDDHIIERFAKVPLLDRNADYGSIVDAGCVRLG